MNYDIYPQLITRCVLCEKEAITTSGGVPTCKEHDDMYVEEIRIYNNDYLGKERPYYQSLKQEYQKEK